MNFKHEVCEWGGHNFIRVSKKRYDNFIRYFVNLNKIEGDAFMGWCDYYDWSLNNNLEITEDTPEDVAWDNLDKCMVAREYFETPQPEYWIRLDYVEANNYNLDTIVPKPREKRLTKKEKKFAQLLCDAFDYAFREACKEQFKK